MVLNPLKWKLHWQIFGAILLAIVFGWITAFAIQAGHGFGDASLGFYDFLGRLFLSALKMLIVPLIASSIIVGVAGIAQSGRLGPMGGKTIGFYLLTTLLAVVLGLVLVNITKPGVVDGQPAAGDLGLKETLADVRADVRGGDDKSLASLIEIFVRMVPENVVAAAAEADMLAVIFFALLFGYYMARAEHPYAETMYNFWEGVFRVMLNITNLVMAFAPVGIFGLVAAVVAETGFDAAQPLLIFAATVAVALVLHVVVTVGLLLRFVAGINPFRFLKVMAPALLTAFSTASSMATLPVTMRCTREGAGVSDRTTSFVLPLGATVNMNGTALYECAAAMFIGQAYGLDMSFTVQFVIVMTALVTSIGVAGVPAASIVAIGIILTAVGLPLEGLGVLLVFDRILDMTRTAVNIYGDAVCAVIVARLEGETLSLDPEPPQFRSAP